MSDRDEKEINAIDVTDAGASGLPAMMDPNFDADKAIELVDKRANFVKRVRMASLNVLQPKDFVSLGGKPYLGSEGCERLKSLWGISFTDITIEPSIMEIRKCLQDGTPVDVECMATARCAATGEEGVFIGSRSSDDKFFGGQADKGMRVDPGHLRKAAYSNMEVNAITRLLGLRALDWDTITQHTGMTAEQAGANVAYDSKGKGKGQKAGGQQKPPQGGKQQQRGGGGKQAGPGKPTDKQLNYLKGLLVTAYSDDKDHARAAYDAFMRINESDISSKLISDQIEHLKNGGAPEDFDAALAYVRSQEQPPDDSGVPDPVEPDQGDLSL